MSIAVSRHVVVTGADDLKSIVRKLGALTDGQEQVSANLDLSGYGWARAADIVLVAAALKHLNALGRRFTVQCQVPKKGDVNDYLSRMDFYDHIGYATPQPFYRRASSGRFLELTQIRPNTANDVISQILDILKAQSTEWSTKALSCVELSLTEVIDNVGEHSRSPYGGLVLVRNSSTAIEIAVADSGVGIPDNLRLAPKYSKMNDRRALRESLLPGVSSTGDEGRGNGLYIANELAIGTGGSLTLYSRGALLHSRGGRTTTEEAPVWPGTFLHLVFGKRRTPNIDRIFRGNYPATILDPLADVIDGWIS